MKGLLTALMSLTLIASTPVFLPAQSSGAKQDLKDAGKSPGLMVRHEQKHRCMRALDLFSGKSAPSRQHLPYAATGLHNSCETVLQLETPQS